MSDYECVICQHPIDWDEVFGWLHEDFGPDGRSCGHGALVEWTPMTDSLDNGHVCVGDQCCERSAEAWHEDFDHCITEAEDNR
jgi:hypothetical protein